MEILASHSSTPFSPALLTLILSSFMCLLPLCICITKPSLLHNHKLFSSEKCLFHSVCSVKLLPVCSSLASTHSSILPATMCTEQQRVLPCSQYIFWTFTWVQSSQKMSKSCSVLAWSCTEIYFLVLQLQSSRIQKLY